jgi:thioredoxin reductase (NADPH)
VSAAASDGTYDVIVVGGGPVGLHAALKAAVLNHRVLLVDKGRRFSRVSQAPAIANLPGRPGVSGLDLLQQGRDDLKRFRDLSGKDLVDLVEDTEATDAWREDGLFRVALKRPDGARRVEAGRVLVLATGVVDRKPGVDAFHRRGHHTLAPYVHAGRVGYCLLCEGWDLAAKRIAVVGSSAESAQVATDVARHFGGDVTLLTDGAPLDGGQEGARQGGVRVVQRPVARLDERDGGVCVVFEDGAETMPFDKVFFTLGWYKANNELAVRLGARVTPEGYVVTDEGCEALDRDGRSIRGLFVAGDLRAGRWKQIVVGWGDAETAVITAYARRLPSADEQEDPAMRGRAHGSWRSA